jgi:hypothetical protein
VKTVNDYWYLKGQPPEKLALWSKEYIELDSLINAAELLVMAEEGADKHADVYYRWSVKERILKWAEQSGLTTKDLSSYAGWHLVIGSTPSVNVETRGDFEGVNSIRAMINKDIDALLSQWLA